MPLDSLLGRARGSAGIRVSPRRIPGEDPVNEVTALQNGEDRLLGRQTEHLGETLRGTVTNRGWAVGGHVPTVLAAPR